MDTGEKVLLKQREVPGKGYDQSLYEAKTIYATSRDGEEKIPIYLVYRKDMKKIAHSHCYYTLTVLMVQHLIHILVLLD